MPTAHLANISRLNERCSHHVEHPHILAVDCAACTFLMITRGTKKKKKNPNDQLKKKK